MNTEQSKKAENERIRKMIRLKYWWRRTLEGMHVKASAQINAVQRQRYVSKKILPLTRKIEYDEIQCDSQIYHSYFDN